MSWIWRARLAQRHRRRTGQRGQVMILFAISLLVLIVAVGIAVDGGYGLYEYRQAQNAADFGADGAAAELLPNCSDSGTPLSNSDISNVIDDLVSRNSPSTAIPNGWTAYYLDSTGNPLTKAGSYIYVDTPGTDEPETGDPPGGACGVHITVTPQWPAFMAQIIGFTTLKTAASAAAINSYTKGASDLTAIAALGEDGAHIIFEGGNGLFKVDGTIYDNSSGCLYDQAPSKCSEYWGGSDGQVDVIDGKQDGNMEVDGIIQSYADNPFDWCFEPAPEPAGSPTTSTTVSCSANADDTKITYEQFDGGDGAGTDGGQLGSNPGNLPAAPTAANAPCSGETEAAATYTAPPVAAGGTVTYYPGIYTYPVVVDSDDNVVFDNCSQQEGVTESNPEAGMFYFEDGAAIQPPAGYTVTGDDVLLVSAQAIPDRALANNVGDGEPAIGDGSGTCDLEDAYEWCGTLAKTTGAEECDNGEPAPVATAAAGTNCNAVTDEPNSTSDQGLNYSLELGGQGTINLTASTGTGFLWSDFVMWNLSTGEANIGLDGEASDSANVNVTGIIYDNSDQQGQGASPQYWDGNAGIPYLPGGMLLAGYGVAGGPGGTGFSCGSYQSSDEPSTQDPASGCQISIDGLAIVDAFQTEGFSTFSITGSPYDVAGIQGTGAILTQ